LKLLLGFNGPAYAPSARRLLSLVLLGAASSLTACGDGSVEAMESSADVPHRLFERPTSRVDLGMPGEDTAVPKLLGAETVWLVDRDLSRAKFSLRAATPGERFVGVLWRTPLEIPPAGHGVSGSLEMLEAIGRPQDAFRVNQQERPLDSLEIGDVLIDARGLHVMLAAGAKTPRSLVVGYPVSSSALLEDVLSPPPIAGEPVSASELRVQSDSRRSLQLAFPGSVGWSLHPDDGGASVRFAYGLKDQRVEVDGDAVRLAKGAAQGARFTVSLVDRDGTEEPLWTADVAAAEAGRSHDARIEALPEDTAGRRLTLSVEHLDPSKAGEQLLSYWMEPIVRPDARSERPNVLVILLDTLRADRLGCYGYDRPTSPVLDRLASEGVVFSDAWSAAPWTLPSHASLFASLYMSEHGVWDRRFRLSERATTIAEVLSDEGYETGAFTSSGYLRTEYGFGQGFDRFWAKGGDPEPIFREALGWIEKTRGPYFAFVHTYHVHSPHDPEGAARDLLVRPYEGGLPEIVHTPDYPWGRRKGEVPPEADVRYVSDLYDAEVREVDHAVGRLLAGLKAQGKLDNTLIVVTSDHGEEFAEHDHFEHGWSLYEEQLAVPLIMHLPGRFEGGAVLEYPVIGIDVAPTIADVVGAPIPDGWSGAVLGMAAPETDRPIWVPYRTRNTGLDAVALRRGPVKYMEFPGRIRPLDPWSDPRLYDLDADPGERADLWAEEPKQDRARWQRAATALKAAYPLRFESSSASTDAQMAAQLKALGYGGG